MWRSELLFLDYVAKPRWLLDVSINDSELSLTHRDSYAKGGTFILLYSGHFFSEGWIKQVAL